MKNSVWLANFENEVNALKGKRKSNNKLVLIMVPVMFAIFGIIGLINGAKLTSVLPIFGLGAFMLLFVLLICKKNDKKDDAKGVRDNLASLLRSDDEVDEFDNQMAAPIGRLRVGLNNQIIFTKDYLGSAFAFGGMPDYRFARYSDIRGIKYVKTKSSTKIGEITYLVDFLNIQGKNIFGTTIDGSAAMGEFQAALKQFAPHINM